MTWVGDEITVLESWFFSLSRIVFSMTKNRIWLWKSNEDVKIWDTSDSIKNVRNLSGVASKTAHN